MENINFNTLNTSVSLVFEGQNQNLKRENGLMSVSAMPDVEFVEGSIFIDNTPVESVLHHNTFYWEHGEDEHKSRWALMAGNPIKPYVGVMEHYGNKNIFIALPSARYNLSYMYNDTITGAQLNVKFILEYGLEQDTDGYHAYCRFFYNSEQEGLILAGSNAIMDKKEEEAMYTSNGVSISVNTKGNLCVVADFSSTVEVARSIFPDFLPGFASYFNIEISYTFEKITGTAQYSSSQAEMSIQQEVANRLKASKVNIKQQHGKLLNAMAESGFSNILSSYQAPLSPADLFSLSAPNAQTVSEQYSQLLFSTIMYYSFDLNFHYTPNNTNISYGQWFGVHKDAALNSIKGILGYKETESVVKYLDDLIGSDKQKFMDFVSDFSKATLSNSFSSTGKQDILNAFNLSVASGTTKQDAISYICRYYFNGTYEADGSIPASMRMNPIAVKIQKKLMSSLYEVQVEGFSRYTRLEVDQKKEWAEKLYNNCVKNIAGISVQLYAPGGNKSHLKHLCTMLDCLDDSEQIAVEEDTNNENKISYSGALYTHILNLSTTELTDSLTINEDNVEICRIYIKEFFYQLADIYFRKSEQLAPDIERAIANLVQECNAKNAEQMHEAVDAHLEEMISLMTRTFANNPISTGLAKNPFAKSLFGELAPLAVYGLAFYLVYPTFKEWQTATDVERGVAVALTIRVVAGVTCDAMRLSAIKTLSNPNATLSSKINAAQRLKFGGDNFGTIRDIFNAGNKQNFSLPQDLVESARYKISPTYAQDVSKVTKFFRMANVALRVTNVALVGFAAYSLGIKITHDIQNHESDAIIAMGILEEICLVGSGVLELISLGLDLAGIVCEFIPYVCVILMVFTVIFEFITSLLESKKPKPDSPEVSFTKLVLSPFVSLIPYPTQEWINKNCKENNVIKLKNSINEPQERNRKYILSLVQ